MTQPAWQLLIISLSGRKAASRMRLWRGLRASGAAVLRDGVYLLPGSCDPAVFAEQAEAVRAAGGSTTIFEVVTGAGDDDADLYALFDRQEQFSEFNTRLQHFSSELKGLAEAAARRRLNSLRREFSALCRIDFFPGEAQAHSAELLVGISRQLDQCFSNNEPRAQAATRLPQLDPRDYQGRLWATRQKLWVDRVASAWLIRRFIDRQARFIWLSSPDACPHDALGFDFDGAAFTHAEDKVTFEVLQSRFGLTQDPALQRLAALVHYLDVGGEPVAEADGFTAILAGARNTLPDDDHLLEHISGVLDNLYTTYSET